MYPLSYLLGLDKFSSGAWYDPSQDDRISWMIKLLEISSHDKAVDIGSGDGRVVMAMARSGAQTTGFEKNAQLVQQSQEILFQAGLTNRARILQADMWQQSYCEYNKVTIYQFKTVMERLEKKLLAELPKGAKIVSNYWQFPHWRLSNHIQDVYLYIKE